MHSPSSSALSVSRINQMIAGGLLGGIIASPTIFVAMISGGSGHGHYTAARALFPVPMLLTLWTNDSISGWSITLIFLQFPLYGALVAVAPGYKRWVAGSLVLALHLTAAFACFSGFIPNFS